MPFVLVVFWWDYNKHGCQIYIG